MIFVTVGTMFPFDRLIEQMDLWAAAHAGEDVFAQIGDGVYEPKHMRWTRFTSPKDFTDTVQAASLIVAHAGTGSFFLAAELKKPVVLVPRYAKWREHTTDHQVHTANWLKEKPGVFVAMTNEDLPEAIRRAQELGIETMKSLSPYAPDDFIGRLRDFIAA